MQLVLIVYKLWAMANVVSNVKLELFKMLIHVQHVLIQTVKYVTKMVHQINTVHCVKMDII